MTTPLTIITMNRTVSCQVFVFFYKMASQVRPQEETDKKLRETKCSICTSPGGRRQSTAHRTTWEIHQETEDRKMWKVLRPQPLFEFLLAKQSRTG